MKENDICIYSADDIYLIDGALYFSFDEEGVCQVTFDNLTPVPTYGLDDYIEHPDMSSDFFSITATEAEEIIAGWRKRSRSKEREILHRKREALSSDAISMDDEFWCPLFGGMISNYDCNELSYGAENERFINDGLPFLMDIEKVINGRALCINCEKRKDKGASDGTEGKGNNR